MVRCRNCGMNIMVPPKAADKPADKPKDEKAA
jgi:DNA-directed RNA polymerase subunit RPC12/RpoP